MQATAGTNALGDPSRLFSYNVWLIAAYSTHFYTEIYEGRIVRFLEVLI